MHPALRQILRDLRLLDTDARTRYLEMIQSALAIHHALTVVHKGVCVTLNTQDCAHFVTTHPRYG